MSVYELAVFQPQKMLKNLNEWLSTAVAYAEEKSFEPAVLLNARLSPDQYPLLRQIQASCDAAKFLAARLAGKEAPSHPDTEQTLEEIRARVQAVIEYLDGFEAKDFEGSEKREIMLPFLPGKKIKGFDYMNEMSLPNFYFHITTAYAILRHNGVGLGKRSFIGSLKLKDVE